MRFADRIVVITGAGSGMGRAAALQFAAEGAVVAVNDLRPEAAAETVGMIGAAGGRALAIPGDVSDEAVAREAIARVVRDHGQVDVLVCNAGVSTIRPAVEYDSWRRSIGVNLDAPFYWSRQAAIQSMIPAGRGAIVIVSSNAGFAAFPGDVGYIASKHGATGLTKALAVEWAGLGIRVNCICPGLTETAMVRQMEEIDPDRFTIRRQRIPVGRVGQPEELAEAMLYLASDAASYVTGLIMNVDGGQMALYSGFAPQ